jgi:hypothetical protein
MHKLSLKSWLNSKDYKFVLEIDHIPIISINEKNVRNFGCLIIKTQSKHYSSSCSEENCFKIEFSLILVIISSTDFILYFQHEIFYKSNHVIFSSKESIRFIFECNHHHENQFSRMFECKICFKNKTNLEKSVDNVFRSSSFIEVNGMIFHQCVKSTYFENDKKISFILSVINLILFAL